MVTNDNWGDLSTDDQTVLSDNNLTPTDPAESALVMTLAPGEYTVIVRGVIDTTGIALVEAYDIDSVSGVMSDSKLANISTRGNVGRRSRRLNWRLHCWGFGHWFLQRYRPWPRAFSNGPGGQRMFWLIRGSTS